MNDPLTLTLPAEPASAGRIRRFIRENATLDSMRHAEADLLATELTVNVIQHSPQAGEITISMGSNRAKDLVIEITHPRNQPLGEVEAGTGFLLLDRLAKDWGHSYDGRNLTFWFTVRTPGTKSISPELTDDDLFQRMTDDPVAYSDELVRRHTDLAHSIARRYRGKGVDEEDLYQVGQMALVKAIQRYDPRAGNIRPYAAATISGEMKKALRDRGWSVRVPRSLQERSLEVTTVAEEMSQRLGRFPGLDELASHLGISETEVAEAMRAGKAYMTNSVDQADETGRTLLEKLEEEDFHLDSAEDRVVVEIAIERLPERKQRILHLRFNQDMTQAEIAEEVGVSQMHVSRLLRSAIEELREIIETTTLEA